jgi:hypothetical protein
MQSRALKSLAEESNCSPESPPWISLNKKLPRRELGFREDSPVTPPAKFEPPNGYRGFEREKEKGLFVCVCVCASASTVREREREGERQRGN